MNQTTRITLEPNI